MPAVARLGAGIERDSIDATVAFRDGRASIVTARAGRKIDSVAIRGTLIRHLIDGDSAPARIAVIDTAPVRTSADLQSVLVRIRQIIGTPLTLIGPGAEPAEYAVTSSELDQLLSIVDSGGSRPPTQFWWTLTKRRLTPSSRGLPERSISPRRTHDSNSPMEYCERRSRAGTD